MGFQRLTDFSLLPFCPFFFLFLDLHSRPPTLRRCNLLHIAADGLDLELIEVLRLRPRPPPAPSLFLLCSSPTCIAEGYAFVCLERLSFAFSSINFCCLYIGFPPSVGPRTEPTLPPLDTFIPGLYLPGFVCLLVHARFVFFIALLKVNAFRFLYLLISAFRIFFMLPTGPLKHFRLYSRSLAFSVLVCNGPSRLLPMQTYNS